MDQGLDLTEAIIQPILDKYPQINIEKHTHNCSIDLNYSLTLAKIQVLSTEIIVYIYSNNNNTINSRWNYSIERIDLNHPNSIQKAREIIKNIIEKSI